MAVDNDVLLNLSENETWVRFTVRPGASFHVAGDSEQGMLLQQGRIWLQVFAPRNSGDGEPLAILDEFARLFRHVKLDDGDLRVFTADIDTNTAVDDGWFMMTASIPYESMRRYTGTSDLPTPTPLPGGGSIISPDILDYIAALDGELNNG